MISIFQDWEPVDGRIISSIIDPSISQMSIVLSLTECKGSKGHLTRRFFLFLLFVREKVTIDARWRRRSIPMNKCVDGENQSDETSPKSNVEGKITRTLKRLTNTQAGRRGSKIFRFSFKGSHNSVESGKELNISHWTRSNRRRNMLLNVERMRSRRNRNGICLSESHILCK